MTNMHLKKPLYHSLTKFADNQIATSDNLRGKILPAQVVAVAGSLVTVSFPVQTETPYPVVEMPVAGWEYIRAPVQIGDMGIAVPADFSISGISGLGTGTGGDPPGNVGAMIFVPIGRMTFSPTVPNVTTIYGPQGVTLKDTLGDTVLNLTPTGLSVTNTTGAMELTTGTSAITITPSSITLTVGTMSLAVNASGVTIGGVPFATHVHLGVTPGSGMTGVVA